MNDYREQSKMRWGTNGQVDKEEIKLGALLRIADALDKIAVPYSRLAEDAQRYERQYRDSLAREAKMLRRIAGLRGYINRKKKKT